VERFGAQVVEMKQYVFVFSMFGYHQLMKGYIIFDNICVYIYINMYDISISILYLHIHKKTMIEHNTIFCL